GSRRAGSSAWSSSSRTITMGSRRRSARCCPKPSGSAATCIFSETRSTTCRARSPSTSSGDDCLMELRWFYDRRDLAEVRRDLVAWLAKWQAKYPKLTSWVEDNLEETLTYYRLPLPHHKHMKSTNMLERLNQELKRRTLVVRIFPNAVSCLRLVRALAIETHEGWLEATRYLNMEHLRERKKEALRATPPDGGRAWPTLRYTGAPRRPRPPSPLPAI